MILYSQIYFFRSRLPSSTLTIEIHFFSKLKIQLFSCKHLHVLALEES